jgi:hypothetical protein
MPAEATMNGPMRWASLPAVGPNKCSDHHEGGNTKHDRPSERAVEQQIKRKPLTVHNPVAIIFFEGQSQRHQNHNDSGGRDDNEGRSDSERADQDGGDDRPHSEAEDVGRKQSPQIAS